MGSKTLVILLNTTVALVNVKTSNAYRRAFAVVIRLFKFHSFVSLAFVKPEGAVSHR